MQGSLLNFLDRAYAVGIGVSIPGTTNVTNFTFSSYMYAVLKFAINIGLTLSGLMIVYGGIKYMLSRGNQTQTGDAKDTLVSAIIGFSLLLFITLILKVLDIPSFG